MSILSTFYSGNLERIQILLQQQCWQELEKLEKADFSGGVRIPFLVGDDFDVIALHLSSHFGKGFGSFSAAYKNTIWGNADGEYQATVLDHEFVNLLGRLEDSSLAEINRIILAKRDEQNKKIEQKIRISHVIEKVKTELLICVLPLTCSIAVLSTPRFTIAVKVLVPVLSFGIVYGLRFWISQWLNSGRKKKQSAKQTEDWMNLLIKLRELAKTAHDNNESVVYMWSL